MKKTHNIHEIKPKRTCDKVYATYGQYKKYIREDFHNQCGYCGDNDYYSGGFRGYHIDHFRPHSIPEFKCLINVYENLVYACPYCNGAKSNKWMDEGFIDPCDPLFDENLVRDDIGRIQYKTKRGELIYKELKMYLKRHELIWCIEKLSKQKNDIHNLINSERAKENSNIIDILLQFRAIQQKIDEYTSALKSTI
jgi:5-methylcytosine-specific restriction endonuclease McrA